MDGAGIGRSESGTLLWRIGYSKETEDFAGLVEAFRI